CPTCAARPLPISGGGALRVVEMVPSSVDFGDVPAGTSAQRQFLLVNKSKERVSVSQLRVEGQGPISVQLASGKLPAVLEGGAQLAGLATFIPDALGGRSGKLVFTVSDGAAAELAFTGFGFGPVLDAAPKRVTNMVASIGTTRSTTLTFTNVGLDPKSLRPLTIASAAVQG